MATERRQLTVWFCDLVDSTPIASRLDPEDLRSVMSAYYGVCREIVERYEGHIAQYLGDGLLAYFGWPSAHEDDAERAIRAGLELAPALHRLNPELEKEFGARLVARVAIHSGPVVVGDPDSDDRGPPAVGSTIYVASRLQALADPGVVVASEATLRSLRRRFVTEPLGLQRLKGLDDPVEAHRIVRPGEQPVESWTHAPLVGRERELNELLGCWRRAQDGHGQLACVSGPAGIGKSRIVAALESDLAPSERGWIEARCSPYTQGSPLHPVIEIQARALGFAEASGSAERLSRIEAAVGAAGLDATEAVPLLASLHRLPHPAGYAQSDLSREGARKRTLELSAEWLLRLHDESPGVFVLEDLHWSDPSTLKFLEILVARLPEHPAFVVVTHRPEFEPSWNGGAGTSIPLERLTDLESEELLSWSSRGRELPAPWVHEILSRSDGIPLFLEEITRCAVESYEAAPPPTRGRTPDFAVPGSLQDSLTARLDRLGDAKSMAQLCAVLGREFPLALLEAVAPPDRPIRDELGLLTDADLLHVRQEGRDAICVFRHALIQEAAYGSLPKAVRRAHHRRTAEMVEARFPATAKAHPERVAHHFTEAREPARALPYWRRAAEQALERSAMHEALSHFTWALDAVADLPRSPEIDALELKLHLAMAPSIAATLGWGSPDARAGHERARVLAERLEDRPSERLALRGLWTSAYIQADRAMSVAHAETFCRFADEHGDSLARLDAVEMLGQVKFHLAEHQEAARYLGKCADFYAPELHEHLIHTIGEDIGVWGHVYQSHNDWFLGRLERSRREIDATVELARELGHPFTLAGALTVGVGVLFHHRDWEALRCQTAEAIELARRHAFIIYEMSAHILHGAAIAQLGDADEGTRETQTALASLGTTGTQLFAPLVLSYVAEGLRRAKRFKDAFDVVEGALGLATVQLDRYMEAELQRLRGELRLDLEHTATRDAEMDFARALDLARERGQLPLELRAASSLARLWSESGRREPGRELLAPVYDRFEEGLASPDLVEARELLGGLT